MKTPLTRDQKVEVFYRLLEGKSVMYSPLFYHDPEEYNISHISRYGVHLYTRPNPSDTFFVSWEELDVEKF